MISILRKREYRGKQSKSEDILNSLDMPVWHRDKNLKITYCNNTYLKLAELPDGFQDVVELDKSIKKLAEKAINSKSSQTERVKIISGGKRLEFEVTEIPKEEGTIGFARSTEVLAKVEQELQSYKDMQNQLLETTASAIAIYGPDQKLKFFNNSFVNLWKLEESWLGNSPSYGEILETLREKRRLPEQADFRQFKTENLMMFSSLIDVKEDFYFLPDERSLRVIIIPHSLGGLQIIYEDMTDKLALESSYNTLLAVQSETLQNLQDGVAVFEESGKLKLSNPVYAQIWGLDEKYLRSEPFFADILNKTKELYNLNSSNGDMMVRTLNREPTTYQLELKNGKVYDVKSVPLPDGEILINYNDITAATLVERSLRERAEALEDVDRLKTEFLTNVSYELRSPLTSVIGFTEILKGGLFGDMNDHQKSYLDDILKASRALEALINDILDISSIEAGYMKLNIEKFDVHAMLAHIISITQEWVRENNLQLHFECASNIGKISGDETRIRQVVFNIISNSIKFTPSGGSITVKAEAINNDKVAIIVTDTGQGIAKGDLDKVFNKFQKSRTKGGTGLGLSVAKNFVELHGGTIGIESEQGKGTSVKIILPRDNEKQ